MFPKYFQKVLQTMKLLTLFILTIALAITSIAQTAQFSEAIGSGTGVEGSFAKWNFETEGDKYEILSIGKIKRLDSGNRSISAQLPKRKNETLSRVVYFANFKTDLILLYEITAGGEGAGYIVRLDGKTLKLKWKAGVFGFNVGKGLMENSFAYITAIGFVGKINLLSGKYVWKHDDLYGWNKNSGAFNSFELPELDGNNVKFIEKTNDNLINQIIINKTTGKIIKTFFGGK